MKGGFNNIKQTRFPPKGFLRVLEKKDRISIKGLQDFHGFMCLLELLIHKAVKHLLILSYHLSHLNCFLHRF